ncbi:DUF3016 domain-containing protein [Litorilituus lipolyticus]|uniref:DUF3016 domain-containing protein n=2 Tax=Litorilituus lipolyticus TaxID=2491017 RepID=A0A502KXC9_9GAMM|nr:DUF3016 domain-containing protein [Litorilituus lipolyticus]
MRDILMNKTTLLTIFISVAISMPSAWAASSEVEWKDYKSYRDIHEGNENRSRFRERTFKQLEDHFAELASQLPKEQVLKIIVTDVDLAGDTMAGGINRMRIVKHNYPPRMNFSYQLLDANGKELKADTVKVRDMNFMSSSNLKYRNKALGYEKKMLDDWFAETFQAELAAVSK